MLNSSNNELDSNELDSNELDSNELFALLPDEEFLPHSEKIIHKLGKNTVCKTDSRAKKRTPFDLVLDATDGFIPLWDENMVLRWTFNQASLTQYRYPEEIKTKVKKLLAKAIQAWGDAAPIRFSENIDNSDFEIVLERVPNCSPVGCTLAQAFFPDAGRHQLIIFPTMFEQSEKEQVDTLIHEIGHIFGLRHFFATTDETAWASETFGKSNPFSIMNYGALSELTKYDIEDLKTLYKNVWSGKLKKINGTPIKLFRPFHYSVTR